MELETNLFDSLRKTLTGSPKDWSLLSEDVWLWGIIVGWHEPCYKEFEKNFSWWTKEELCENCLHELYEKLEDTLIGIWIKRGDL